VTGCAHGRVGECRGIEFSPITAKQASLMPRKKGPLCVAEFSPDNQGKQESTELNG
jgi:hypothetical protein